MRTRSSSLLSPAAVKWAAAAEDGLPETGAVAEVAADLGAGRAAGLGVCAAAEAARGATRQRASTRMAYLLSWGGGAQWGRVVSKILHRDIIICSPSRDSADSALGAYHRPPSL